MKTSIITLIIYNMVVELLNLLILNKKSHNIHLTLHQPQLQYDNNLGLLKAR